MVITDFLERNARLYGSDTALVEVNPSEERDSAVTWREASLIAEAQPDAPYRRELSWRDFDRRANRFANFLLSRGVERGTKVGILLMNCLEWLPIYFGILKAGCIAVPLNFRYASDEISYCLDLADVEVLVFGPEFVSRLDPIQESLTRVKIRLFVGRNVPGYAEDCRRLMGFCSSSVPPIALSEDDDAAIYFSSGTTGFPKAILHRHKALVCSCMTEQHHHGQTKDDVFLCIPPLYHTGAKMHWFGSLISGSKAVLLRGVKPEWILRTITEEKCTIVWLLVPWAQDILDVIESGRVNLDHYLLDQWRLMHIGAQPVPPSLIKRWLKYFPHHKYDTNYGLSESIGPGCVHLGVDNIEKIGAIGKAGYLWQTRIIDEQGQDVAPGAIGELAVKGPGVMKCYYKTRRPPRRSCTVTGSGRAIWPARTKTGSSIWSTAKRTSSSPAAKTSTPCRSRISCAAAARSRTWPSSACPTSGSARSRQPSSSSRMASAAPRRKFRTSAASCRAATPAPRDLRQGPAQPDRKDREAGPAADLLRRTVGRGTDPRLNLDESGQKRIQ